MMFPVKDPSKAAVGFAGGTCTITCHSGLTDPQPGQKVTRHYMENDGEIVDFWHWKRDRHELAEACDDGFIDYPWKDGVDQSGTAAANARRNDEGTSPYSTSMAYDDDNDKDTPYTGPKGPKYVIPNKTNYYWITKAEIDNETAVAVTNVADDGKLTLANGLIIDPKDDLPSYSQGFGNKRMPSVIINPGGQGADGRSEVRIKAKHTGSGWQLEIKRLLVTGDDEHDADFSPGQSLPFGLVIFNNAAIGHAQSNYKTMTIE